MRLVSAHQCCGGLPSEFCSPSACWGREMGYLEFFYVEAKSFEFQSEVSGGAQLVERSIGVFRAVVLGRLSVFWLPKSLEVLIKGDNLCKNWRTFHLVNTAYVLQ